MTEETASRHTVAQSPATPDLKALTNELKTVSDWHTLGVNLDLKSHQLKEIERNYRGDDKRCKTEVLDRWLESTPSPTWEAVVEALCLMEAHIVADSIRRKYITSATITKGENAKPLITAYLEDGDPGQSGDESDSECGFCCGCGNCNLATYLERGCSSSLEETEFPYLFPKKPSTSELKLVKWKLVRSSRKIVQKFALLERNTISMLKEKQIPLDEVKNYVLTLGAMLNESVYKDKPLLLQEKENIEKVQDFGSLFFILKGYYSWFSFGIIEALREDFLFDEVTGNDEKLHKYKLEFQHYCRHRIFECPKSMFSNSRSEGLMPLILKVNDDFSKYNLNHVLEFQSTISEILGLSKYTLQLCDVTDGCVTVVFKIPSWIANLITINSEEREKLMHIGVKQLRVMHHTLYEEENYSLSQQYHKTMDFTEEQPQVKQIESSTCDQEENGTVVMREETQEQLHEHMDVGTTLSLVCKSLDPITSIHTGLDLERSTATSYNTRLVDVDSPKDTKLQRHCSLPIISSQPSAFMYHSEIGSENVDPYHIDGQKISYSSDGWLYCLPRKPLSSTSSSVNVYPLVSLRSLSPMASPLLQRKRRSQSSPPLQSQKRWSQSSSSLSSKQGSGYSSSHSLQRLSRSSSSKSLYRGSGYSSSHQGSGYSSSYCLHRWSGYSSRGSQPGSPSILKQGSGYSSSHSLHQGSGYSSSYSLHRGSGYSSRGSQPGSPSILKRGSGYSSSHSLHRASRPSSLHSSSPCFMDPLQGRYVDGCAEEIEEPMNWSKHLQNASDLQLCKEIDLLQACGYGQVNQVLHLLMTGVDPNVTDFDGWTALQRASFNDHKAVVDVLLRAGANPDLQDKKGIFALYGASKKGYDKIAEILIWGGATVNLQTKKGWTALKEASFNGHKKVVEVLLKAGANPDLQDRNGFFPLSDAAQEGYDEIVELLLQAGATVDLQNKNGATPLYMACQNGHLPVVEQLIAAKADVNCSLEYGTTPLYIACQNGHLPVVEHLIAAKADVNTPEKYGATPLYIACQNGHLPVVEHLIAAKADVNTPDKDGVTPLYIACQEGHLSVGEHLIAAKADANTAKKNGISALIAASYRGHSSMVEMLLKAGATINTTSQCGTALHAVVDGEHEDMVQLLMEAKIDLNLASKPFQETALMMAAWKGNVGIVRKLIQHGANVNLTNKIGFTAFDIAHIMGHINVCQELQTPQFL